MDSQGAGSRKETDTSDAPDFRRMLRGAGLKVTGTRLALLELVASEGRHLTADEITALLHKKGIPADRVTIYRNIERLMRDAILLPDLAPGRAVRVALGNGPGKVHHHHVVCDICGRVTSTDGCFLQDSWDEVKEDLQRQTGYEVTSHLMQFSGTCPDCAEKKSSRGESGTPEQ